jgi:hypothetical protein
MLKPWWWWRCNEPYGGRVRAGLATGAALCQAVLDLQIESLAVGEPAAGSGIKRAAFGAATPAMPSAIAQADAARRALVSVGVSLRVGKATAGGILMAAVVQLNPKVVIEAPDRRSLSSQPTPRRSLTKFASHLSHRA